MLQMQALALVISGQSRQKQEFSAGAYREYICGILGKRSPIPVRIRQEATIQFRDQFDLSHANFE